MSQSTEPHYCFYHPTVETELRCNKCGKYICPKDAVRTPVGYRCKGCVKEQQDIFFTATPIDYVVAAVVASVLSMIAALIIPALGFFAIFGAPIAGTVIAEGVLRTSGKRRGRYIWLVVIACMIITACIRLFMMPEVMYAISFGVLGPVMFTLLWMGVYLVISIGIVAARLRFLKIG
jgi:hypothetical protein